MGEKKRVTTFCCGEAFEEYDYQCPHCGSTRIGLCLEDALDELGYRGSPSEDRRFDYADYGM